MGTELDERVVGLPEWQPVERDGETQWVLPRGHNAGRMPDPLPTSPDAQTPTAAPPSPPASPRNPDPPAPPADRADVDDADAPQAEGLTDHERLEVELAHRIDRRAVAQMAEIRWVAETQRQKLDAVWARRSEILEELAGRATANLDRVAAGHVDRLDEALATARERFTKGAAEAATALEDLARRKLGELGNQHRREVASLHGSVTDDLRGLRESTEVGIAEVQALATELERQANRHLAGLEQHTADMKGVLAEAAAAQRADIERLVSDQTAALDAGGAEQSASLDQLAATRTAAFEQLWEQRVASFEHETNERIASLEALRDGLTQLTEATVRQHHDLDQRVQDRRTEIEEIAADRITALDEAGLRVAQLERLAAQRVSELDDRAADASRTIGAELAQLEQAAARRAQTFDEALAAAQTDFDTRTTAVLSEKTAERVREFEATTIVARTELLGASANAMSGLDQSASDRTAELKAAAVSASAALEHLNAERATAFEVTAETLRRELEELRSALAGVLEQGAEGHAAALDRAATTWLARIDRAGRKRRAAVWRRRTGPPAAVTVLATGVLAGGVLAAPGGHDPSKVARGTLANPTELPVPAPGSPGSGPVTPSTPQVAAPVVEALPVTGPVPPHGTPVGRGVSSPSIPTAGPPPAASAPIPPAAPPSPALGLHLPVACGLLHIIC